MSQIFWESEQKAGKEHFCYFCCNYIEIGQRYKRHLWVPRKGSLHVMNCHLEPGCPPNIGEEIIREMERAERAALGVPIAFVVAVKEVIVLTANGESRTEQRTELTMQTLGTELAEEEMPHNDEEIAF